LWAELAADLEREGLLTKRSEQEFAAYCQERAVYAIYSELLKGLKPRSPRVERYRALAMKANDRASRLGGKFGMTPSDQVGLHVPVPPGTKPTNDEEFLFGRSGTV
jgi:phage terminase small subunit